MVSPQRSYLIEVRGLKRVRCSVIRIRTRSHPLRMRGLKHSLGSDTLCTGKSHLDEVRRLKLKVSGCIKKDEIESFMGATIGRQSWGWFRQHVSTHMFHINMTKFHYKETFHTLFITNLANIFLFHQQQLLYPSAIQNQSCLFIITPTILQNENSGVFCNSSLFTQLLEIPLSDRNAILL